MLTHTVSTALWAKFAAAPSNWLMQNKTLAARSALVIRRKCGSEEAHIFIALVRAAMVVSLYGE